VSIKSVACQLNSTTKIDICIQESDCIVKLLSSIQKKQNQLVLKMRFCLQVMSLLLATASEAIADEGEFCNM
jgi:hypothetical protein